MNSNDNYTCCHVGLFSIYWVYLIKIVDFGFDLMPEFCAKFFLLGREATDSYAITASPSSEILWRPPNIRYSSLDLTHTGENLDPELPLLSEKGICGRQESNRGSAESLGLQEHAASSLHFQYSGEAYVGYGCSFTQTLFNGKQNLCWLTMICFFFFWNGNNDMFFLLSMAIKLSVPWWDKLFWLLLPIFFS